MSSAVQYLFRAQVMKDLLIGKEAKDFGRELIPAAIRGGELKVMAYHLDSFWEDIGGSIADFYRLNISLTGSKVQPGPSAPHSYLFSLFFLPFFAWTPKLSSPPCFWLVRRLLILRPKTDRFLHGENPRTCLDA